MRLSNLNIDAIQKIRHFIECQIHSRSSIKELCDLSELGETKLSNGFKFLYQTTISQYHLHISMEYAKAILEDGAQVKEVAILFGYKTPGHFSRAFSKVFGEPPGGFKMLK